MQECRINIRRHSGSSKARVRIERDCETVSIQIIDNGRGISAHDNAAKQVGGELKIESGKSGTTVRLVIPVNETETRDQSTAK